jgi:hypothetical protein
VTARSANGRRAEPPHAPADWAALQYQPDPRTPLLRCRCGAAFLADEPGRQAHLAVFGHRPRASKPRSSKHAEPREREPEASDGM